MAYKIGEVAKLLGISSETVRYYEREGVIQSQKIDQESGYRYYEALDINALMRSECTAITVLRYRKQRKC